MSVLVSRATRTYCSRTFSWVCLGVLWFCAMFLMNTKSNKKSFFELSAPEKCDVLYRAVHVFGTPYVGPVGERAADRASRVFGLALRLVQAGAARAYCEGALVGRDQLPVSQLHALEEGFRA